MIPVSEHEHNNNTEFQTQEQPSQIEQPENLVPNFGSSNFNPPNFESKFDLQILSESGSFNALSSINPQSFNNLQQVFEGSPTPSSTFSFFAPIPGSMTALDSIGRAVLC